MANWTSRAETLRKLKRAAQVQRGNGALLVTICNLRHELETKDNAMRRLELVIHQRNQTIDNLNDKLAQSREQCRRLDAEADRLAALFQTWREGWTPAKS
jgi:hypothetical protein